MREPCRLGGDITRYRNSLLARSESERSLPDVRHVRSAPSWPVNATISPARRPEGFEASRRPHPGQPPPDPHGLSGAAGISYALD